MRATHHEHRFYSTGSLDLPDRVELDNTDSLSCLSSATIPATHHSNTYPNHGRSSSKFSINTANNHFDTYDHGLMINSSFFDGHLFQPARSSYIVDYQETSTDFNQFVERHSSSSQTTQSDAHLFKLSFILTLSDWHIDHELILNFYPRLESNKQIIDEINNYKRFCFPELNINVKQSKVLSTDTSTYVFTRVLANGQIEYGYCRRVMSNGECVLPYPIVFCLSALCR
jgi:hypothetical protein